MMKYIIIVFVAVITVFIGGRSLNQVKVNVKRKVSQVI